MKSSALHTARKPHTVGAMPNFCISGRAIGFASVRGVNHSSVLRQSSTLEKTSAVIVAAKVARKP